MRPSNLLLLGALSGCVKLDSDVDTRDCRPEVSALKEACFDADVVGSNDNPELETAIAGAKECIREDVGILCSELGIMEPKVVSIYLK